MKVILLKTNLKEGLSAVERGVTESNSLPVLKNILIKTFNNRIRIDSTNLEIPISRFVESILIRLLKVLIKIFLSTGKELLSVTPRSTADNPSFRFVFNSITFIYYS